MTRAKDRRDRVGEGTASTARLIPAEEPAPNTVVGALTGRVVFEGDLVEPTGGPWDAEAAHPRRLPGSG